ncbi:MAG: DUF4493 domain-containing protein [Bacteroidales bacterium]|nr:DUF4493 domain-containing protein [Bacteroidales bacterium]
MKHFPSVSILSAAVLLASCSYFSQDSPSDRNLIVLPIRFHQGSYSSLTRASSSFEIPDTNDFILTVGSTERGTLYHGTYGAAPEKFAVSAGTYTVKVESREVSLPKFDSPVFGDEKCVVVQGGSDISVVLECSQTNAGIRLNIDRGFLNAFPLSALYVKSGEKKLLYSYSEKRIAYFPPGDISIMMTTTGEPDKILFTRYVGKGEILTVDVYPGKSTAQGSGDPQTKISLDTSRVWTRDAVDISDATGGGTPGGDISSAIDVARARESAGEKKVWVYGYIVGGDLSSGANGLKTSGPFSAASNLAIAGKSSVTAKSSCISVQLTEGAAREALNLVSNPGNLGRKVFLKGDIVASYFGITGIKNVCDWEIK